MVSGWAPSRQVVEPFQSSFLLSSALVGTKSVQHSLREPSGTLLFRFTLTAIILVGCHCRTCASEAESVPLAVWNFEADTESWQGTQQCQLSIDAGILYVDSRDGDPHFSTQIAGPTGWKRLVIRLRSPVRLNARISWTTEASSKAKRENSVRLKLAPLSNVWCEHEVYFHTDSPLTSIRIDPHNRPGRIEVNSIKLFQSSEPPTENATDPKAFRVKDGFRVELLYSVPAAQQGSWVSMTVDPQGRLITSDQYGHLYRVTPSPRGHPGVESVEKIDIDLGSAQGLLCAFDSLYVMVNQSKGRPAGLYRVRDLDGDDQWDSIETLKLLQGRGGEHGPHAIVLSPDGETLTVVAGNNTDLPTEIEKYRLPKNWGEDLLLPRNPCPSGLCTGRLAPGGWVCRVSPDGKQWELVAGGFRNPYDLAFNREGEMFTFESDMEQDIGAPWYKPTRLCHVTSGSDFGWRYGTGKWPEYFPDCLPAMTPVGLGSPTGLTFGYGTDFPDKYRDALFACDWTYGRMFAVHLKPSGGSYSAELEDFVSATPLPLTDVVVNPIDQAMYFITGGRKTQSGLYRVTWKGQSAVDSKQDPNSSLLHEARRSLEALHGSPADDRIDFVWKHLGHEDRFVRYAARIALEHSDVEQWRTRVFEEEDPETAITGLLALSRTAELDSDRVLAKALQLWQKSLSDRQRTDLLRALGVMWSRNNEPAPNTKELLREHLEPHFPCLSESLNYELCQVLVFADSAEVVPAALELMSRSKTQEDLLNYAMTLRIARSGWSDALRKKYLSLLNEAEGKVSSGDYVGGGHLQAYIHQMRTDAASLMTADQREAYAELLQPPVADLARSYSPTPRKFVKHWTVDHLLPHLEEVGRDRSFKRGEALFHEATCSACHRFNNRGGIFGPDLTAVSKRFSRQVLLREIIDPSAEVSDLFQMHVIATDTGHIYAGRVLQRDATHWTVAVDPKQPSAVIQIPVEEIEASKVSETSLMPGSLLDTLELEEILDLIAYLESAGDPNHDAFRSEDK